MTSRVLNDALNTHFKSYRVGIFNGKRSARESANTLLYILYTIYNIRPGNN